MRRVSNTFHAPTLIVDQEGTVVASSMPKLLGLSFDVLESESYQVAFRIPYCFQDQSEEIIVCDAGQGETISTRLAQVLIEMILDEITERRLLPAHREVKNKLIFDLLHDHIEDETVIMHSAELLRLDLTVPRSVILIGAADYILGENQRENGANRQVQRRAQFIIDTIVRFFFLPNDLICAYLGNGDVAVLKAADSQNLSDWSDTEDAADPQPWVDLSAVKRATDELLERLPSTTQAIDIGVGRYHPGISGLAKSYKDAKMALALGRRFNPNQRIHCLDELGVAALVGVSNEETKIELAEHLLSPLNDEPELLKTLECFFAEDCAMSVSAQQLCIHRNTLSYRLDKIASIIGLDPRSFNDAVQIRLALLLRKLHGA